MTHIVKLVIAAAIVLTGCDQGEGTTVGPRGGVVASEDGRFTLEIPEGALEQDVEITIEEVECDPPSAIDSCYEMGPVGLPLLFPGTIVYDVNPEELDGLTADDLTVLVEREEDWKPLADHRVDMAQAQVTASAVYLSSFAVVVVD